MKTCIIYHSDTGMTGSIARFLAEKTGGDLVRVRSRFPYSLATRVLTGTRRALFGHRDPVYPSPIDVTGYDAMVVGSPVWARSPTPVINGAVDSLKGAEGKPSVVFVTCCLLHGNAHNTIADDLEQRGVRVQGTMAFTRSRVHDRQARGELLSLVKKMENVPEGGNG
jgi:hypothetical protein